MRRKREAPMAIKEAVKIILGKNGTMLYRTVNQRRKYVASVLRRNKGVIASDKPYRVYQEDGKHLFFGYYDLQQMNAKQDKLLAHRLPQHADASRDAIEIGWLDHITGHFHQIAESRAWCWQQGSRLRWHSWSENCILFNSLQNNEYCTEQWDIVSGKRQELFPCAFYDITSDFAYGLSLNFSRLQRLRPGYGYSTLPDHTCGDNAPEMDGIFRYDLISGERIQLVSLRQLATASEDAAAQYQHYINHICVAPDGKHFMFLHLWTKAAGLPWKVELYSVSMNGDELKRLEGTQNPISHYCWKDERTLLTTTCSGVYAEYDIITGKRTVLAYPELRKDGHPTYFANKNTILADTYPLKRCMQHLFKIDRDGADYHEIASIYSDPRLFEEKRCDLHPRLTPDGRYVTVDSTFSLQCRSVVEWTL